MNEWMYVQYVCIQMQHNVFEYHGPEVRNPQDRSRQNQSFFAYRPEEASDESEISKGAKGDGQSFNRFVG